MRAKSILNYLPLFVSVAIGLRILKTIHPTLSWVAFVVFFIGYICSFIIIALRTVRNPPELLRNSNRMVLTNKAVCSECGQEIYVYGVIKKWAHHQQEEHEAYPPGIPHDSIVAVNFISNTVETLDDNGRG